MDSVAGSKAAVCAAASHVLSLAGRLPEQVANARNERVYLGAEFLTSPVGDDGRVGFERTRIRWTGKAGPSRRRPLGYVSGHDIPSVVLPCPHRSNGLRSRQSQVVQRPRWTDFAGPIKFSA